MTYVTYTQIDQMKKQCKGSVAYSKKKIIIKHIIEIALDKYTSSKEKKKLLQFT